MPSDSVSLPLYEDEDCNDYTEPSPRQVLRIAINLKNLIDILIPSPIPVHSLTEDSTFLSEKVMTAVYGAAGGDGKGKGSICIIGERGFVKPQFVSGKRCSDLNLWGNDSRNVFRYIPIYS